MTWAIGLAGFSDPSEAAATVTHTLNECGVSYDMITIEINNSERVVINIKKGEYTEGITQEVSLPPLKQFLDNWANIITALSEELPDTAVTLLLSGVVQVAINGEII